MNYSQRLKDVFSTNKLKSAPIEYTIGFGIFVSGLLLLLVTDWRIALGIILFQWGQNIHDGI